MLLLAFIEGGWLAFDGGRALVVGDYVTPSSGTHAGRLGRWSKLVSAVGIDPRSTLMKSIHLLLGLAWLVVMVGFVLRLAWTWWGMLACAIAALWYLPFGTLLSVIQIVLLLLPQLRVPGE
ncbi:MAG TPA: hypothetical protein VNL70_03260 [Tepidisphaeraceae bacterium]|nr:hypothetical protein [Tepidisphaeraceae bacterium]